MKKPTGTFLLRGANSIMVNLPHDIWKDTDWKVNNDMELIMKKVYNKDKNTAYTLTIRKAKDWENE